MDVVRRSLFARGGIGARYAIWFLVGLVFLTWELLGVTSVRAMLGLPQGGHPSLSAIVWSLEDRFGPWAEVPVLGFLADLALHFALHTPLAPGVG